MSYGGEQILTFGKDEGQVGILTTPATPSTDKPLLLILNAGIVHRVGPYRSTVDFARKMATEVGLTVFRVDLSGLGDSQARQDSSSDEERAIIDIQQAMNFLGEKLGARRFVLMGLCSGADNAHPVAVRDERVVGGIMLDGFGYETPGFYFHHYFARVTDPVRWRNVFYRALGWLKNLLSRSSSPGTATPKKTKTYVREFPDRLRAEAEVQALVDRGMQILYIYTSGVARYLNHKRQFRAMFPRLKWKNRIQLEFYPQADHTYSVLAHREWLFTTMAEWLKRIF